MTTEVQHGRLWWSVGAEFTANFYQTFLGMGCIIILGSEDVLTIALCVTFVTFSLTTIFGHASGAHLNPIVSAAMSFTRQMTPVASVMYTVAQFLGCIVAAKLLELLLNRTDADMTGFDQGSGSENNMKAHLVLNMILASIRVFVYLSAFDPTNGRPSTFSALAIAATVGLAELVCIPITGSSGINPARALAFALCTTSRNAWKQLSMFLIVSFVGGMFSAVVYPFVFAELHFEVKEEVQPLVQHDHDHKEAEQP